MWKNGKTVSQGAVPSQGVTGCESAAVQSLSSLRLFATPWTAAHQTSLSITVSQSLLKFMSVESVVLSNPHILCHPLLLLPSLFASIRVFSSELALHIKWPKYWSFSICPSNEYLLFCEYLLKSANLEFAAIQDRHIQAKIVTQLCLTLRPCGL